MIEIVLAGPPMGKQRVRQSRATGRLFTPQKTVNYEGRLALAGQQAMAGRELLTGPLRLDIEAYVPVAASWPKKRAAAALAGEILPTKKPDLDNIAKIAADALNMVVWVDDSQIVEGSFKKRYSAQPRLVLRVYPLTEEGVFS